MRGPEGRIAYLVGRYPTVSHTFVLREVLALRELGVEVDTFSIHRSAPDQVLSEADRGEAARTYNVLPPSPAAALRAQLAAIAASPAGYVRLVTRAFRLARPGLYGRSLAASWIVESLLLWQELRRRGIRHVHAHLPGTAPAVAMLTTDFANRVDGGGHTWSLTVHGPAEFYEVSGNGLPEKVRSAAFAVAISDFGRSQLMGFVGEEHWSKLHVVHCGVNPDAYALRSRDGTRAGGGGLRLVSVGRLAQVKGHGVLLEAMTRLRARGLDVTATIVGDGPKRDDLEKLALELGLGEAVRFTGAIGQDEIDAYYETADVFVHPSFAEGIPVVLMEAMAHGLPVVATSVMGVGELVRHGRNGTLVRPGRPDQLTEALERLAADPERRRKLGEAGRRTVEREFDVRSSAARMRELFETVG